MRILLLSILALLPAPLLAQAGSAYHDPVAAELVARARAARGVQGASITSYTALVRDRGAAMLRLPLRDRLLARSETAARVRWSRDGATVVQLLASRDQEPEGVDASHSFDPDLVFDPSGDRIHFGLGSFVDEDREDEDDEEGDEEELWIAHPLADGSEAGYRYRSGDTITIGIGGRRIRAVELHVEPREPSFHHLNATLWIEPETGALVQAVFRPSRRIDFVNDPEFRNENGESDLRWVPGLFRPIEADLESVIVQYALWELEHWLPRMTRVEGYLRAGAARVPFSRETAYEIESVDGGSAATAQPTPEEVLAAWNAGPGPRVEMRRQGDRDYVVFSPEDEQVLLQGEALPPPIWDEAPEFAAEGELEGLVEELERSIPRAATARGVARTSFAWGLSESDLVRYNRVEGLSVGARASASYEGLEGRATVRLGLADLHPNVELAASRAGARRTLGLALYHQLAVTDPASGALGLGNSLGALVLGRDAGEYYRATGARLTITPPEPDRPWYRASLFAERQRGAERGTEWSGARLLGSGHAFRPNLDADAVDLVGGSVTLAPWWGADPLSPQAGVEIFAEGAEGDARFARSRVTARTLLPLSTRVRLGAEAAGGTAWGDLPAQYAWFLGGPETLRGYPESVAAGPSFARSRVELVRSKGATATALFADGAWAGERDAFDLNDALLSAGVGFSVFDGILRVDLARALRRPTGWRVELYLDALL